MRVHDSYLVFLDSANQFIWSSSRSGYPHLYLVERFRRVNDDTLLYEFTVEDPSTFTQTFSAALPMKRGDVVFEYACHEGNYGLFNILSGARESEIVETSQP